MRFLVDGSRAAGQRRDRVRVHVSGARAYPPRGMARKRAGIFDILFYWLAMPFHNRNYRAFNHFLAGRHVEGR